MVKATSSSRMNEQKKQDMRMTDAKITANNDAQHMEHETRASRTAGSTEAASRGGKHSSRSE